MHWICDHTRRGRSYRRRTPHVTQNREIILASETTSLPNDKLATTPDATTAIGSGSRQNPSTPIPAASASTTLLRPAATTIQEPTTGIGLQDLAQNCGRWAHV